MVEESAIVRRGQLEGVFVIGADSVARIRWVRLGREMDGRTEVLSGLAEGERYLVTPDPGFADASPVEAEGTP
jgi:hypothetical protein